MDINVVIIKRTDGRELFIGGESESSFADILYVIASEVGLDPSQFVGCSFKLVVMSEEEYNSVQEYVPKD